MAVFLDRPFRYKNTKSTNKSTHFFVMITFSTTALFHFTLPFREEIAKSREHCGRNSQTKGTAS